MRERAINLRDWEVRAILDGRKTMLRRPVRLGAEAMAYVRSIRPPITMDERALGWCPFGAPGDLLWVRECWAPVDFNACDGMDEDDFTWCTQPGDIAPGGHPVLYRATVPDFFEWNDDPESRWRSSIHVPRWASRLTLRVTDVRVERLQDITEEDARAEGAPGGVLWLHEDETYRTAFRHLWSDTYGPESWTANPWCWCVSFERAEVIR